jgi:hypothetical protein
MHDEKIEDVATDKFPARRRSLTEPSAARDFAVVKEKELANVGAVAV